MALMGFDDTMDDMFGRVDRMMNSVMRNMFGDPHDPYGFNMNNMMTNSMMMAPFGRYNSLFPYNSLQPSMVNFNAHPSSYDPSSSFYCSSSVMSMTTDANGRPQIYEATSSTHGAGGVREVRSTVRDSASGLQQMSIGHHIHDRGHVLQRSRNNYTGEEEHNEEYLNMDEADADEFNNEWGRRFSNGHFYSDRHYRRALTHQRHGHRESPQLALPAPPQPPPSAHASSSHVPEHTVRGKSSHRERKHKEKRMKKVSKKS